jgi:hypothetical protein
MPAINVLYLPRDERLRMLVRTALDFIEEVYRDEVVSGLRIASFDLKDDVDVEQVKRIAVRENLGLVERSGRELEPVLPYFFTPHYQLVKRYAWVPVSSDLKAPSMFSTIAHEVTFHAISVLPDEAFSALLRAFRTDVGLDEIIMRRKLVGRPAFQLFFEIRYILYEIVAKYIIYNYFEGLEREAEVPTFLANIKDYALEKHRNLARYPPELKRLTEVLSDVYLRLAYKDLVEFRRELHKVFTDLMIKKLPVDVLESNRAKYGILYREGSTVHPP